MPEAGSLQVPIKKPSPKCIVVPIVLKMEDVDHQVFFPQDALVISVLVQFFSYGNTQWGLLQYARA